MNILPNVPDGWLITFPQLFVITVNRQANKAINPTVSAVTLLAGGSVIPAGHRTGKRRAVRPAGYGRRLADAGAIVGARRDNQDLREQRRAHSETVHAIVRGGRKV